MLSSSDPHPETLFWHSFWHTIWKYGIFILTFYLTFYLAYTLTFSLASGWRCPPRGWGPAVPTESWRSQLRSGSAGGEGEGRGGESNSDKSRDPHLAGGELEKAPKRLRLEQPNSLGKTSKPWRSSKKLGFSWFWRIPRCIQVLGRKHLAFLKSWLLPFISHPLLKPSCLKLWSSPIGFWKTVSHCFQLESYFIYI